MQIIKKVKSFISSLNLFLIFIMTAFTITVSTQAKAEYYYEPCDDGYWVETPVYHSCKPYKKKHYTHVKKKTYVKKRYYQTIVVPVYTPTCGGCYDCCSDCCDNYNPDLTTGDDDPSIYPDLDVDR